MLAAERYRIYNPQRWEFKCGQRYLFDYSDNIHTVEGLSFLYNGSTPETTITFSNKIMMVASLVREKLYKGEAQHIFFVPGDIVLDGRNNPHTVEQLYHAERGQGMVVLFKKNRPIDTDDWIWLKDLLLRMERGEWGWGAKMVSTSSSKKAPIGFLPAATETPIETYSRPVYDAPVTLSQEGFISMVKKRVGEFEIEESPSR